MADLLDKIKEAEQMLGNEEQAIEIAKLMNLRNFDEEKLTGSSPFSSDSNPSFIWNRKDLCYHDFSNGGNYSIINAYMYAYDETYAQALKRLFDRCHIEFDFKRGFGYDERESLENYKFPIDDSVEDSSNAVAYLKKRGFTEETIKFFDIGQTKKGDVQFKLKDINGRLVGVKYRHAHAVKHGESKYWWQGDCSPCYSLFNINHIDITQPLTICEGYLDAMAIWQSGNHNVVSIPGGATDLNWIKYNFDFLEKFKKITLWLDNDTAGEEGTKKIVQKLGEYRCYIVESPDYAQEAVEEYYKQFNQEKPIRKTDANNVMIAIDGSAVLKMIADAKAVENPRVKHLFDYEEMQLQNVPNISFGIKALNKVLYGNFQNTLTLITGTAGCVDCDTEFFTGTDWKRIADFQDGDKVLQYNEDGTTSLVYPSIYHKYPCDKLWHFETTKLDQCLSDEHTIVYYDKGKNLRTKSFAEVREIHNKNVYGFRGKFIRSFKYNGEGIDLTDAEIKLMCAVICDGCFHSSKKDSNAVVISVKKERKKNRVREILKECAIDYHETVNTKGYTNFYFYAPRHEKEFTDYWYNCSQHQLQVICDNILFWDGHVYNNGAKVFFTSVECTATFIQFAFVSTGHYASLNIYDRRGTEKEMNGKTYTRNSLEYTVQISDQVLVGISGASNSVNGKKAEITEYKTKDGFKYCFTVPSHMWVMRRNRKIVVSGNCGKSSVLNQIGVAAPLEQNRNVFIYSGEIPAQFLLGNIFRPMASNRHIVEFDNGADRPKGYAVSKQATDLIRQCYHENLYVYDDCFEGDNSLSTEGTGLLKQMDYSYRRYGTDVYIIDNLMTIDLKGCTGETKFEKQIDFIKQLKMFTRKYPVEVFLVAHSRKLAQGETEVGLQSVAGASEISNLADRCIACKILNEDSDGYDFQLSVVKDRQSGKAGSKLKLYYDNCSMRIFSDEQELNMRYRWERELGNKIHYDDNLSKRIVANIPELKFNPVPTFTSEPDIPTESTQEQNLPF
jgi:5S rRNA maturation endonuclease (ribonuclease M5)